MPGYTSALGYAGGGINPVTHQPYAEFSQTNNGGIMTNAWFFQGNVGVRPIAALDINAALSFANADKLKIA